MKTKLPTEWQELSDQLGFQEFTPHSNSTISLFAPWNVGTHDGIVDFELVDEIDGRHAGNTAIQGADHAGSDDDRVGKMQQSKPTQESV